MNKDKHIANINMIHPPSCQIDSGRSMMSYVCVMDNGTVVPFFVCVNYRLMHALFHIRTVIIPRNRYQPEGFSPRVDIGRGMTTVQIWKKACINLFITYFNIEFTYFNIEFTYFNIELKRTQLISHTHTHQTMSDRYRLRDDNSPDMEKGMHCSIYKEA
jgi:hypothetical protein